MNTANVSAGKPRAAGAIFRAPIGTTLPTSANDTLDTAFVELGFVSDDGVTNNNAAETDDINAWGGTPVLNIQTAKPDEWTFTLIEALNVDVLKTVYGDANVTTSNGVIHVEAKSAQVPDSVYVIDMAMRDGALKRVLIPVGSLGEVGEIVYKDDEPVGYELTIKALDNGSGKTHDEWIAPA